MFYNNQKLSDEELANLIESSVFYKIVNNQIPCNKVYENDTFMVIRDMHPLAAVHWLILPKKPLLNLSELCLYQDTSLMSELLYLLPKLQDLAARELQQSHPVDYRLVSNSGTGAGQSVAYLHFHFLSDTQKTLTAFEKL